MRENEDEDRSVQRCERRATMLITQNFNHRVLVFGAFGGEIAMDSAKDMPDCLPRQN